MNLHSALRLIAGFFTLLSAVMIYLGHTNWCPMITMLKKAGLSEDGNSCS